MYETRKQNKLYLALTGSTPSPLINSDINSEWFHKSL